jgi:hypothetical protein
MGGDRVLGQRDLPRPVRLYTRRSSSDGSNDVELPPGVEGSLDRPIGRKLPWDRE